MKGISPPKRKRGPAKTAPRIAKLRTAYRLLDFLQAPFALLFWWIEQAKARLQDSIEKERRRHT